MRLLRLISLQYVRRHRLRTVLTTAGIVLGVGVFLGMHSANESVRQAFQRTVDRVAGATQLQISAGDSGFEEAVLERVQSLPEVRVAVPAIEATVETGLEGQGSLLILAVDMTGDRSLREYDLEGAEEEVIDDPLIFLAQPDSLIVSRQFAERNGLGINSRLALGTAEGERRFVVRGLMRAGGLASAFGGNLAVMDVYAAQKMFGRGRRFDRIDVGLREDVTIPAGREALEKLLGPGFQVEPPSSRREHFESMARALSISISFSSLFALLIGLFIIYNSFSIAVTQRRSEIGILRALGATRAQVRGLFLAEGLVAGLIGSAAGVLFGLVLARGTAVYISGLMGAVYGVAQQPEALTFQPWLVGAAIGIGSLTSVVAAWVPARDAARVDPVTALQKGKYQVLSAGESRRRRNAALLLATASTVCLLLGRIPAFFYAGYLLAVVAALLMTPASALLLAKALRPVLRRLRPVEGALAADSLIESPRRTSATVAALMLSLALAIGFAGIARASYLSIVDWLDAAFNPALFVTSSRNLARTTVRFPSSLGDEIRRIPGVRLVQMVRNPRVNYRGGPVMLVATDIASLAQTVRRKPTAGDRDEMNRLAAAGKAVIISDNLALMKGLRLGDTLELPAPNGTLRLPVAGIVIDYSDQQGVILLDRSVYVRYWSDDSVNVLRVYLEPGQADSAVKQRIQETVGARRRIFVFTNAEVRGYILRVTEQWFGLTWVQLAVAVLVAVLGIVNSLTVSITDRRRELGVLRAVGALRDQVRHTVWMEAMGIAVIGLALGLALGGVALYFNITMIRQSLTGVRLDYVYPAGTALLLVPVIMAAAFLAAIGPAESAVRGSLVEALEYE